MVWDGQYFHLIKIPLEDDKGSILFFLIKVPLKDDMGLTILSFDQNSLER